MDKLSELIFLEPRRSEPRTNPADRGIL